MAPGTDSPHVAGAPSLFGPWGLTAAKATGSHPPPPATSSPETGGTWGVKEQGASTRCPCNTSPQPPVAQKPPSLPVRIPGLYHPRAPWQLALLPVSPSPRPSAWDSLTPPIPELGASDRQQVQGGWGAAVANHTRRLGGVRPPRQAHPGRGAPLSPPVASRSPFVHI